MSYTNDLRKLIKAQLDTLPGQTYHKSADDQASYPYKVYDLERVDMGDLTREDYALCIDLWDRDGDWKRAWDMADQVKALFWGVNLPQETILPTFFPEGAYPVDDKDKQLQHIQLHFSVQMNVA